MSADAGAVSLPATTYLNHRWTLRSWLLTHDHKRIALLYLLSITLFFFIGGVAATLIRINLVEPQGLFTPETYNRLFTVHGMVMVWFFLIPSIPATLGNFLMPLMIGARDLAFPRINLASWYLYIIGGLFTVATLIAGGVDTGWTFYTPFCSMFSNSNVMLAVIGVFIVGFSSIFTGLNFIVTVHKMRAPGITWFRLPLFVWAMYATSLVMVLATPVLAMTLMLIAVERVFHVGVFDPALGGDPMLFQHLFWFYSHPAVYIMVLPAMGVVSEVITCFARRPHLRLPLHGLLHHGHRRHRLPGVGPPHVRQRPVDLRRHGVLPAELPRRRALGHQGVQLDGHPVPGLASLSRRPCSTRWASSACSPSAALPACSWPPPAMDVHVTDTYFVVAHFHYIMVGGTVMAYLGGIHFWWPKITGRMYSGGLGAFAAILMFFGFNLTFFPQFILGYLGMPRRYHAYPPEFQVCNVLSSAGASILAVSLSAAARLSALVAAPRRSGRAQSLGRTRTGMDHRLAAAAATISAIRP